MFRLLTRRATEAPPEYVAFVERHLRSLRRDTADVAGDEMRADELCTDVLTDVADRWTWLELQHHHLGRADAQDAYLNRALFRRAQQWRAEQESPVDIYVWRSDDLAAAPRPPCSSAALRMSPYVVPERQRDAAPVAEAGIAWWHAFEAYRRRKLIGVLLLLVLAAVLMSRAHSEAYAAGPPAPPAVTAPAPTSA